MTSLIHAGKRLTAITAVSAVTMLAAGPSLAQSVALAGVLGSKALLVVDAHPPRALGAGDEFEGIRVIAVTRDEATIEIKGARRSLRLGEAPVSVGNRGGTGRRIVLNADGRGHFISNGLINGKVMQYMVDTGASTIAIGRPDADRLGLPYQGAEPVRMNTANGVAQGWRLKLDSVRIGDVEVFGVEAIVTPQAMPYVLLGNSFLTSFQMTRNNEQMVLEKRN
ncbi:MAG: retropepsin-like aspartic protease [Acidovorax sp.]|uniref:retropepsin-like aspartic protease family protein n=1 Tax=Acidovorax sp. TaxID=1872122 RepID=UPI00260C669F|nr:retropepsin-like aspartic protease [Acidovorax sp.]MDH4425504.1 retropepsin-like aspartic protease [Acidovorax sp.]MDH4463106.1 retropepsin-like aspartic protease [Acidovorax sp.]